MDEIVKGPTPPPDRKENEADAVEAATPTIDGELSDPGSHAAEIASVLQRLRDAADGDGGDADKAEEDLHKDRPVRVADAHPDADARPAEALPDIDAQTTEAAQDTTEQPTEALPDIADYQQESEHLTDAGWNADIPIRCEGDPEVAIHEWQRMLEAAQSSYGKILRHIKENGCEAPLPSELYEDAENMARAWRFANDQYFYIYHHPDEVPNWSYAESVWDTYAMDMSHMMRALIDPERATAIFRPFSNESRPVSGGYISQLIEDENFKEKAALTEYLSYDVWLKSNMVVLSRPGGQIAEIPRVAQIEHHLGYGETIMLREYKMCRETHLPLIRAGLLQLAKLGYYKAIKRVFQDLEFAREHAFMEDVLFEADLTLEERRSLVVQHVNVMGFIETIDILSTRLKTLPKDSPLASDISALYRLLQGEEVHRVLTNLTEVYSDIEFGRYGPNQGEIVRHDADRIERAIKHLLKLREVHPDESHLHILDIGAGTGRHIAELQRRGVKGTIAVEFESRHTESIKRMLPEADVVRGDWHHLPFPDGNLNEGDGEAIDVFYCLGRTLPHNRTPADMMRWFGEVWRVTSSDAVGIVDIPDVETEQYRHEIQSFAEGLEEIPGIDKRSAHLVFDGPDDIHKFNRLFLDDAQMRAYIKLFGFRVITVDSEAIEGIPAGSVYYMIEKDPDFMPSDISRSELRTLLHTIGMYDAGTDFSLYIEPWGMTIGQAILFGLGNEGIVWRNLVGQGPAVTVEQRGTSLYFTGVRP